MTTIPTENSEKFGLSTRLNAGGISDAVDKGIAEAIAPMQASINGIPSLVNDAVPPIVDDAVDATFSAYIAANPGINRDLESVQAASTVNLALTGAYTVDGRTMTNGDRYLARAQTAPAQNGVYVYNSAGAHTRATDNDAAGEFLGRRVFVNAGSTNVGKTYLCTTTVATVGTDAVAFVVSENVAGETARATAAEALKADATIYTKDTTSAAALIFVNEFDQITMRLNKDGSLDTAVPIDGGGSSPTPETSWRFAGIKAELLGSCAYGQSLSIGSNGTPIITSAQRFDSLRFGVSTRVDQGGTTGAGWFASVVPLTEVVNGVYGETPLSGACESLIERIIAEDGRTSANKGFRLLAWAAGKGGTALSGLVKGQEPYDRITRGVTAGVARAAELGVSYDLPAIDMYHGEADTSGNTAQSVYIAGIEQLRADLDADIAAITGFDYARPMFGYQVNSQTFYSKTSRDIALAQLEMHKAKTGFFITTPNYIFETVDGVHLTAEGYKWAAAYTGLAHKRVMHDGLDWECLRPLEFDRQGEYVYVKFSTDTQLVLDATLVGNPGNFGFDALDAGGSALAVSSVAVVGKDRLKFTFASDFPSGGKIRGGFNGTSGANSGPTTGARMCLRDSLGDTVVFDTAGINKRLDRYAVFFSESVA